MMKRRRGGTIGNGQTLLAALVLLYLLFSYSLERCSLLGKQCLSRHRLIIRTKRTMIYTISASRLLWFPSFSLAFMVWCIACWERMKNIEEIFEDVLVHASSLSHGSIDLIYIVCLCSLFCKYMWTPHSMRSIGCERDAPFMTCHLLLSIKPYLYVRRDVKFKQLGFIIKLCF